MRWLTALWVLACWAPTAAAEPGWLKGQLHLHSGNSGDSETPPPEVARWYADKGYDFIVFTDHNVVTRGIEGPDGLLVGVGAELTQNPRHCTPPPRPGTKCLLHVNALFATGPAGPIPWTPLASAQRFAIYGRGVDTARRMGALAMINHPNFHHAADAALLLKLAHGGAALLEVANEAVDSNNDGDPGHPSTVALWDAVLSAGGRMWGVATDDAHHYADADAVRRRGEMAFTGDRGFVMVWAERRLPAIRAAVERGRFYATKGLRLMRVAPGKTHYRVEADGPAVRWRCVADGRVILESEGRAVQCPRAGVKRYLRVEAARADGARAWTQPLFGPPGASTPPALLLGPPR